MPVKIVTVLLPSEGIKSIPYIDKICKWCVVITQKYQEMLALRKKSDMMDLESRFFRKFFKKLTNAHGRRLS